jgi:hypothetical protein
VGWNDDDDEWGKQLPDDPESVERRRETMRGLGVLRRRALRWAYAVLGILVIVVVVIALTR